MSQQPFNIFLMERLTAVGEDIYSFAEKLIQHYEDELCQAKRENVRLQQMLDKVYKPDVRLQRADVTQAIVPAPSENPAEQQPYPQDQQLDEPQTSKTNNERMEIWINNTERQFSSEDSSDGDALTKELIKTVQQLEDRRATEEGMETKENETEGPKQGEKKRLGTTLYRCHVCHHLFTKKILLTWHQKIHQSKLPKTKGNFVCHLCGKQTPCPNTLQSHMSVHTGERPLFCLICGESFNMKAHMTEHVKTHAGEEPFNCHSCTKSFNKYSTLRKHVSARHSD